MSDYGHKRVCKSAYVCTNLRKCSNYVPRMSILHSISLYLPKIFLFDRQFKLDFLLITNYKLT